MGHTLMVYLTLTVSILCCVASVASELPLEHPCYNGTATLEIPHDMAFGDRGDSKAVGFLVFEFPIF